MLYPQHNPTDGIEIYAWGEDEFSLPSGMTRTTLRQTNPKLAFRRGDLLLFETLEGMTDSVLRHVVRLIGCSRATIRLRTRILLRSPGTPRMACLSIYQVVAGRDARSGAWQHCVSRPW